MRTVIAIYGRVLIALVLATCMGPTQAERIKDLATVQGVRANQLIGYGLVVGLDGSGDQTTQTPFTVQSIASMLGQLGINLPPGTSLQLRNVAAVIVTASLPAFAKPGQQLDVTVSSMGNARSLRGGTLLLTPLKGADGQVYGMAQGNLLVGGAGAAAAGSSVQVNHLSAGRIPAGATVERGVPMPIGQGGYVHLELNATDFGMARRVAEVINEQIAPGTAVTLDARVVQLRAPASPDERVSFLARVESLEVEAVLPAARVIINARTGSVVMNQAVTLSAVAIAHGNLTVTVSMEPVISQPTPFSSGGRTVVAERANVQIKQDGGQIIGLPAAPKLSEVVKALNAVGVTPQDLLAILQAMKSAGALRAELEII
ncbi:MAG: flagellar basal body P-ring protein FlgI [Betaproteobacteria bacterium]|nr:flagellar basal body P-ring protein FlgI [Betaproteobacteria bacterium]